MTILISLASNIRASDWKIMVLATLFAIYSVIMSLMPILYWNNVNKGEEYHGLDWGAFVILGIGIVFNYIPVLFRIGSISKEFI